MNDQMSVTGVLGEVLFFKNRKVKLEEEMQACHMQVIIWVSSYE